MTKIALHCTCGAAWTCSAPAGRAAATQALWDSAHCGAGHAPCSAKQARRARAKAEKEASRE